MISLIENNLRYRDHGSRDKPGDDELLKARVLYRPAVIDIVMFWPLPMGSVQVSPTL